MGVEVILSTNPAAADERITVKQAAVMMSCSEQTVRNRIKVQRLVSGTYQKGIERQFVWVSRQSVREFLQSSTRSSPSRIPPADFLHPSVERAPSDWTLMRSVAADEGELLGQLSNAKFANLALIAANESHERAIKELAQADRLRAEADLHRADAIVAMNESVEALRGALSQYQLPSSSTSAH